MKIINILFLTNNDHKINEYKNILPQNFNLITLKQLNLDPNYSENGNTFEQNAQIKLNSLPTKQLKNIDYVISEDSGICVEALKGEPGIYSARYSGKSWIDNNNLVLQKLSGVVNRQAFFVAVIGIKNVRTGEISFCKGTMKGFISEEFNQDGEGFAYDFIFIPNGYNDVIAKLGLEIKNQLSHRYKAIKKLVEFLTN